MTVGGPVWFDASSVWGGAMTLSRRAMRRDWSRLSGEVGSLVGVVGGEGDPPSRIWGRGSRGRVISTSVGRSTSMSGCLLGGGALEGSICWYLDCGDLGG